MVAAKSERALRSHLYNGEGRVNRDTSGVDNPALYNPEELISGSTYELTIVGNNYVAEVQSV